ncbi:Aste57867_21157 [Aphanomyces stellatus]|uniref:Aste57867_21157 protein n=1 Tax=Aphanomyces stellatus TaxID=120398 RepID=A0A485LLG8_9STRA|nr:hypothetical protein As57867_021089 [Aphanomyces stellatus]VFT97831.1 Aste57867_21157 [Aphanomyces stellatus]
MSPTRSTHHCIPLVLFNADFLAAVAAFQPGLPIDFVPFAKYIARHPCRNLILEFTMSSNYAQFNAELDDLAVLFKSYLAFPEALARLPRLFDAIPRLAHKTLCFATATADFAMLDTLLHMPGYVEPFHGVSGIASYCGRLDVLHYLAKHKPDEEYTSQTMRWACQQGHFDIVKFLHPRVPHCMPVVMDAAAGAANLPIVLFLHIHRTAEGCSPRAMDDAAAAGAIDVVRFLHAHRTEGCTTQAMDYAAAYGHLDVVQFLHHNRREGCTSLAMTLAACNGFLDVVKFLHTHRTEGCTERAWTGAVYNKHDQVAAFVREHRHEITNAIIARYTSFPYNRKARPMLSVASPALVDGSE